MKKTEESNHIQQLLDRFMSGESTLQEERELEQYFATHEVSSEWQPYKEMFAYFEQDMPQEIDEAQPAAPATFQAKKSKPSLATWTRWAVAAVLAAIAVTIGVNWHKTRQPSQAAVIAQKEVKDTATSSPRNRQESPTSDAHQLLAQSKLATGKLSQEKAKTRNSEQQPQHHMVKTEKAATATANQEETDYNPELELAMMQDAALLTELRQQMLYDNMELAMIENQVNPVQGNIDGIEIIEK